LWLSTELEFLSVEFPEIKKPEKVEDETADWKTYRNEEYGFEIKYPEDWYINERKGNDVLTPWFTIVELILNEKEPDKYEKPFTSINIQNEKFVLGTRDWKEFKLGQIDAEISCDTKIGCEIIFWSSNLQSFYIKTKNDPFFDKITNQILSTFRFLE